MPQKKLDYFGINLKQDRITERNSNEQLPFGTSCHFYSTFIWLWCHISVQFSRKKFKVHPKFKVCQVITLIGGNRMFDRRNLFDISTKYNYHLFEYPSEREKVDVEENLIRYWLCLMLPSLFMYYSTYQHSFT